MIQEIYTLMLTTSLVATPINEKYDEQIELTLSSVQPRTANSVAGFNFIGGSSAPQKVIDDKLGYVYYDISIYKAAFTENSNLFLVHMNTQYTPGYDAKNNGYSGYQEYYLTKGFAHMNVYQYYSSSSKHGGQLKRKAFWPKSEEREWRIETTYGTKQILSNSIEVGTNLTDEVTLKSVYENSIELSYTESTSTTYTEPSSFSAGQSTITPTQIDWRWEFTNDKNVYKLDGAETHFIDTYYLFEMDNYSNVGCSSSAFMIDITLSMTNVKYVVFPFYSTKDYSVSISCFI